MRRFSLALTLLLMPALLLTSGCAGRVDKGQQVKNFLVYSQAGRYAEAAQFTTTPLKDYLTVMGEFLKDDRKNAQVSYHDVRIYQVPGKSDVWRATYQLERRGRAGSVAGSVMMEFIFQGDKIATIRSLSYPNPAR